VITAVAPVLQLTGPLYSPRCPAARPPMISQMTRIADPMCIWTSSSPIAMPAFIFRNLSGKHTRTCRYRVQRGCIPMHFPEIWKLPVIC
jgi:hypothetical protein